MTWLRDHGRIAAIVAGTVALPLLLALYVIGHLWALGRGYQQEIDALEPRIARYLGLEQAADSLSQSAQGVESRVMGLTYPAADAPGEVAATLQRTIRGMLSDAGLTVSDSRIEADRREGAFDLIGLSVSVRGSIAGLDTALSSLAAHKPLLLVSSLDIARERAPGSRGSQPEEQQLVAKLQLVALRAVE